MEQIRSPDEVSKVIHGTNFKAWNEIQRTGLNKMKRNHIHFAAGEPGSEGVISGMRATAQVTSTNQEAEIFTSTNQKAKIVKVTNQRVTIFNYFFFQVYIYIDVHKAMSEGLVFFRSANNVILSPGNEEGTIETKYFKTVKNVKTNQLLEFNK